MWARAHRAAPGRHPGGTRCHRRHPHQVTAPSAPTYHPLSVHCHTPVVPVYKRLGCTTQQAWLPSQSTHPHRPHEHGRPLPPPATLLPPATALSFLPLLENMNFYRAENAQLDGRWPCQPSWHRSAQPAPGHRHRQPHPHHTCSPTHHTSASWAPPLADALILGPPGTRSRKFGGHVSPTGTT